VLVTPLNGPEKGAIAISFDGEGKQLLLSAKDYAKVRDLLGGHVDSRRIALSPAGDGVRICVAAVPS